MSIDDSSLAAFVFAATAIVISPGPDTMLILRHTIAAGRGSGFAAVAGVQTGLVGHTLLAAAGLSALIASSALAFHVLALVGASYLALIGFQALRSAATLSLPPGHGSTPPLAFRQAMLCNLLNPKVIVLFLALYPNFMTPNGNAALQVLLLSGILLAINVIWQGGLVLAAFGARQRLLDATLQRRLSQVAGLVFIAFAAGLLWEHVLRGHAL